VVAMFLQGGVVNGSIRTLFWDLGGVLLTNGWDKNERTRVLSRLGVDLDAYEEVHDRANYYWERGLITARDFFAQTVLNANPTLALTFDILWKQVCAESKVLHPECLDFLAELKRQNRVRLATLNNESRELNGYRLDAFKLRSLFDYFICSGYVHEMKPMQGIYRSAVDISGFDAKTALFIDDKQENCTAAEAIGMKTIRFETPGQLCTALAEYDIHVS
jgi:HAD superfamily hydrolase (TIGR01509 family)